MSTVLRKISREPVLITGIVTAAFGVLVVFGVELTQDQIGAVVTFVGAGMALLRFLVTPTSEVVATRLDGDASPKAGPAADVETGTSVEVRPVDH